MLSPEKNLVMPGNSFLFVSLDENYVQKLMYCFMVEAVFHKNKPITVTVCEISTKSNLAFTDILFSFLGCQVVRVLLVLMKGLQGDGIMDGTSAN